MTPAQYRMATLAISSAGTTPSLDSHHSSLALYQAGLGGEAGEVIDEIKKYLWHEKPLDIGHLLNEIGDVYWYLDRILMWLGLEPEDAMAANVAKLRARYPDGWDAATKHYDHKE